jgi:hypothetical protein
MNELLKTAEQAMYEHKRVLRGRPTIGGTARRSIF